MKNSSLKSRTIVAKVDNPLLIQRVKKIKATIMKGWSGEKSDIVFNMYGIFLIEISNFEKDIILIQHIIQSFPQLKLITAEQRFNQNHLDELIRKNVKGYLVIESDLDDLDKMIDEVQNGHYCFSRNTLMGIKQTLTTNPTT